ncbi:hypothetical protein [Micromonospora sp. CA-246542]|uniref:hypothetical protein n=1 Tax=Micromonospora sp. CA-246542 TaxID=3239959 RepID=UPI003D9487E0
MLMRRALALVLLTVGIVLFSQAVPAAALPDETGRYYVVGPPVDGQREYLYDIALRTLGNGNRFREITQLNIGRKQPDGGTFTDGVELRPGWLLVLPRDAKGSGVRTGALPPILVNSPLTSRSPAVPKPSATAPRPGATTSTTVARSPTTAPTVAARRPPASGASDAGRFTPLLVRGGAGLLAAVFAVFAVLMLRRGRYGLRAVALDDTGPWPPERHHTPTPAELAGEGETEASQSPPPLPRPAPPPPSTPPLPPAPPSSPPLPTDSSESSDSPDSPESRPAALALGEVPCLRTDLLSAVGPVRVRLIGMANRGETPAYAWLAETEPTPPSTVPLVLGSRGTWRLHVDLGQTPDVLTLVGALDACQRLAAALARRLHAGRVGVAVIGEALGTLDLEGYQTLTALPEPPAAGEQLPDPCVIFLAGLPSGGADGLRGLVAATGGRCIPVVVGPVPHSRWSIQVGIEG